MENNFVSNPASKDLELLINQAKNGDRQAFEELYNNLYTPLFRFVKSRVGNHDKALDICQDVFLRWYKSFESYEIRMKPLSYLMMIAMRLIINDNRKVKTLSIPEELEELIPDNSLVSADIVFDNNTDFESIRSLFAKLSDNQQNVLTMRYIADADTETIAEALDTTHANVRKLESRALQKLRELYNSKSN